MNSTNVTFDKLLAPAVFGRHSRRPNEGYRQLLSDQHSQREILAAFDMSAQLVPFERNSFTEFSHSIFSSPIEKLSGKLAPKMAFLTPPESTDSNLDLTAGAKLKRPAKSKSSQGKKVDTNGPLKKQASQDMARADLSNSTGQSYKQKDFQAREDETNLRKRKTAKLRLSSDLMIKSTSSKLVYPRIDPIAASAELAKRTSALGRDADWLKRSFGRLEYANTDSSKNRLASALNTSEPSALEADSHVLAQTLGALTSENLAKKPTQLANKQKRNEFRSIDEKSQAQDSDFQNHSETAQKGIDKRLLSKLEKIDQANYLRSKNDSDSQQFEVSSNANKKVPKLPQERESVRTIKHVETTSASVGGLRGLAALANTESNSKSSQVQQDMGESNQTNVRATNLIHSELPKSAAEKQQSLASDLAKSLAEEARRAGIDLEKFQP